MSTFLTELQSLVMELQNIDLLTILNALKPIVAFFTTIHLTTHFKLIRNFFPQKIKSVQIPSSIKEQMMALEEDKVSRKPFHEYLLQFSKVLMENFSPEDLQYFYHNIRRIKIKNKASKSLTEFIRATKCSGVYYPQINMIEVSKNYLRSLFHELFHMASSRNEFGTTYSGFSQNSLHLIMGTIGNGFNEGYTQLLTERYFGYEFPEACGGYDMLVWLMDKMEDMIGKDKMQKLYLQGNLHGLIEECKQYLSEDEIMRLISAMDTIAENYTSSLKKYPFEKTMIKEKIKEAFGLMMKMHLNYSDKKPFDANRPPDYKRAIARRYYVGYYLFLKYESTSVGLREKLYECLEPTQENISLMNGLLEVSKDILTEEEVEEISLERKSTL